MILITINSISSHATINRTSIAWKPRINEHHGSSASCTDLLSARAG